jgi:hypothetical protein
MAIFGPGSSVGELRSLLGADAPLGHALRLR